MPKFKAGDPQLTFSKKGGGKYTKTYHSRSAAARAAKAMRKAGAKILKSSLYNPHGFLNADLYNMAKNAKYRNAMKRGSY